MIFIRKNTKEIRNNLELLGYIHLKDGYRNFNTNCSSYIRIGYSDKVGLYYVAGEEGYYDKNTMVDCGQDEELFMRLALNAEFVNKKLMNDTPTTYKDCLKYINNNKDEYQFSVEEYQNSAKLLICREAYRKGWNPNWLDKQQDKWCIVYVNNELTIRKYNESYIVRPFAFQSFDLCYIFLSNFKDLILNSTFKNNLQK